MVRLKDYYRKRGSSVLLCFNSKMVRLKVTLCGVPIQWYQSFNSKMVRLKVDGSLPDIDTDFAFQFQNGAIKRLNRLRWKENIPSFNSKMVRLKENMPININGILMSFNSKMVRLKGNVFIL